VTKDQVYQAWAPADSIWSRWVKPVLFAHLNATHSLHDGLPVNPFGDTSWVPAADQGNALVVDLPGAASIVFGLSTIQSGYRPVPLFNSVPAPFGSSGRGVVVDMSDMMPLLVQGASQLNESALPADAPPAFLLDSRRRGEPTLLSPLMFDNRSISLPTDFPSANFLLANQIQRILVVQAQANHPQNDLAHTLRRWQDAGIKIFVDAITDPKAPMPITIDRPPWFRHIWYGLLARFGLRRNPLGGFGGFIPEPSSSAG
jgi:hypothetical protein